MAAALLAARSPADWLREMEEVVVRRGGPQQDNFSRVDGLVPRFGAP